jgi:ABC-2 type transport system permease protein
MRACVTLIRRELGAYLFSLTGYIIIAASLFMTGLVFVILLDRLQVMPTPVPVTELFFNLQFYWLIPLLAAPVLTMRLFALERFSGTYETLMTTPVTDFQVVASKFAAAVMFYMLVWVTLLGSLVVVRHYTGDPTLKDFGALGSTMLGVFLTGSLFISLGCFASSLTRSQVAAAMMGLGFGTSVILLAYFADKLPDPESWRAQLLATFALFDQMHDYAHGVIDTRSVVLLASLTMFVLFLTLRVVESRRWK